MSNNLIKTTIAALILTATCATTQAYATSGNTTPHTNLMSTNTIGWRAYTALLCGASSDLKLNDIFPENGPTDSKLCRSTKILWRTLFISSLMFTTKGIFLSNYFKGQTDIENTVMDSAWALAACVGYYNLYHRHKLAKRSKPTQQIA